MFKLNDSKRWPVIPGLKYKIQQDYADAYNYLVSNKDDLGVITDIITKEDMLSNNVPTSLSALIRKGIDNGGASIFLITTKNIREYVMDILKSKEISGNTKDLSKVPLHLNKMYLENSKGPNIIDDVTTLSNYEYTTKVLDNFLDSIKNYVRYALGDDGDCYDLIMYNQHIPREFYDVLSIPVAFKVKLSRTSENVWKINLELCIVNVLLSKQARKLEYIMEDYIIANNNIENLKLRFKNTNKCDAYLYKQVHSLVKPLDNTDPADIKLYGVPHIFPFTALYPSRKKAECDNIAAALSVDIILSDNTCIVKDEIILSTDSVYTENMMYSILYNFKDVISSKYIDIIKEGIYLGDRDLSFIHHLMLYKKFVKNINRKPASFKDTLKHIETCTGDIFEDMYIDREAVAIMKKSWKSAYE